MKISGRQRRAKAHMAHRRDGSVTRLVGTGRRPVPTARRRVGSAVGGDAPTRIWPIESRVRVCASGQPYDLHFSRAARAKYEVDDALFSLRGTVVLADFYAARLLAQKINQARDIARHPERAVQAGELNALGLIHEIFHFLLQQYRQARRGVMTQALAMLYQELGPDAVETTLRRFVHEFPPVPVYRGQIDVETYLNGATDGVPHREVVLEEMILLWLENQNPAAAPFKELFDDSTLARETAYPLIMQSLQAWFTAQEPLGPEGQTLFDLLRAPFVHAPHSLAAQLDFILYRWHGVIGVFDLGRFHARVLGGMQLIHEEQQFLFRLETRGGGFTPTTPPVPVFGRIDEYGRPVWFEPEPERFSPDLDWMPHLVLIAKSTYVWLDQLSKQYGRAITRLDQIPDEELDELARRGITGIWLIGVWERSPASARIKQLMGNPHALASAYSIYDYRVAAELGGAAALENLKARAWPRGIRLASDMVPNHMGLDSPWVIEHPEWFIQSDRPPYPAYSFTGPDLSSDPRVTIQIEDHYWDQSDAAVVFKYHDHQTGVTRYIYHGNDGTSFPWNDTAQLNYLLPQVREQVMQTILRVARQFPVIRFDAAMTLAKKHYQRLWYPLPGEKDTIPSRGEYAMTKEEFDAAMPQEFWREVVERVAAEAPDTLLLAEAFWLMEGYFVRTLGMHRVYNSAFMHMLRDEKNQEYRLVIKNTIEFDPEVLKRYVNFMNNPDERTAVDQFGKGDKYFGVCTLMVTLPGLPMFGHGQIEGFTERYGMEFRTAMLEETPDPELIARHAREIFPLLHKRRLFAEVEHFLLYDVYRPDGTVDENVFAYSNRYRDECALVAYNNSSSPARGTIRVSAAYRDKSQDRLVQRTLAEGLNLCEDDDRFTLFRDHVSGLEYIRRNRDLIRQGLEIELDAYKYAVYLDWRQVTDTPERPYAVLYDRLQGRGVPSIQEALQQIRLEPLHNAWRELMEAGGVIGVAQSTDVIAVKAQMVASIVGDLYRIQTDPGAFAQAVTANLAAVTALPNLAAQFKRPSKPLRAALADLQMRLADATWLTGLRIWAIVDAFATLASDDAATRFDEAQLGRVIADALRRANIVEGRAWQFVALLRMVMAHPDWAIADGAKGVRRLRAGACMLEILNDASAARFLNINRFGGVVWFNKEAFEALVTWLQEVGAVKILRDPSHRERRAALVAQFEVVQAWRAAASESEYRVDKLLELLHVSQSTTQLVTIESASDRTAPGSKRAIRMAARGKKKTTTRRQTAKPGRTLKKQGKRAHKPQ